MTKNNKIAKQAASVEHDKTELANHPYLKHSQDKFGSRRKDLDNAQSEIIRLLLVENERLKEMIKLAIEEHEGDAAHHSLETLKIAIKT